MKKIFLFIAVSGILASCEREMPVESTPLTDLIKDKYWLVIADSTVSSEGSITNEYNLLAACEKDNLTQFKANKTAWLDAGAVKCNSSEAQTMAIGTWSINETSKVLSINSIQNIEFKIQSLSSTQMVLVTTETSNGITLTETVTFKAN